MKVNNLDIKERFKKFRAEIGVPIARIGRDIDMSTSALFHWIGKSNTPLSDASLDKIDKYLKKFGY